MGASCAKSQDVEEVTERVKSQGRIRDDGGGREEKPGVVYVMEEMRVEDSGHYFYKIGQSDNPARRRGSLQTGNPRELKIFAVSKELNDCVVAERDLMKTFEEYKCPKEWKGGTEWFMVEDGQNQAFRERVKQEISQLH